MKRFKWALLIIGSSLFAACMWGLLTRMSGSFLAGFIQFYMIIGIWLVLSCLVWLTTRLPFLPSQEFIDCVRYGLILLIGIPFVKIGAGLIGIPDCIGYILGAFFSVWACVIQYNRTKKEKKK